MLFKVSFSLYHVVLYFLYVSSCVLSIVYAGSTIKGLVNSDTMVFPHVLRICVVGFDAFESGSVVANMSQGLDELCKGDHAWTICPDRFGYGGSGLANVS